MTQPDCTDSIFSAVVALTTAQQRAAYLDQACAGDDALRARVEVLLRAHERAGHLLDRPVPGGPQQTVAPFPPEQPGTLIAGRYKLLEAIGEGGMGAVWVAEQTQPVRRKVALKLIKAGMDSKSVLARFEAERQALAVMDHPGIAKVLDGGLTESGRPFFVMEYVKGVPITEYCEATRLSISERLQLFVQVCQAVQHAHQKGIIHRDLKPSNILVAPYDDKPVPKVIDFGLAKAMHQSLTDRTLHTAHETVLGTPLYMSPEQAQLNNLDVDTRSDLYSLGVLLYELLTGTTPLEKQRFKEAAWDEIRRVIREEEPPRPSTRLSSSPTLPSLAADRHTEPARLTKLVRGELDWIVMKALEKDRNRRYETANGFALDVQRYLSGEPVQAAPPSARYRLRKFTRKHRGPLAAAAAMAALLLMGILVSTWQAVRATRAGITARAAEQRALQAQRAETERATGERLAKLDVLARQAQVEQQKSRAEAGEKLAKDRLVQVDAEKKKAEEEKQIAQAVRDFLQNKLLGQADARTQADSLLQAGGRAAATEAKENPTIRELLDRAARELSPEKIDESIPQPLVQAEILRTVGNTYRGVGEYQAAISFLQRSAALYRQHLGPDHPHTLTSMHDLALAYQAAGMLDLALPLLAETLKVRKAKLGPDDPDALANMSNLAAAYQDAGKRDLALPLYEESLRLAKAKLGPDHPQTLVSMNNLAVAYQAAGKRDLALPLFEETLKLMKANLGPDHPRTLNSMNNLAEAYQASGKLDLALPLLEETLRLRKAKLGADHPETLVSMSNLAEAYQDAGKRDLALPLLEETLRLMKAKLGPDHPDTLTSMNNLAEAYQDAGKRDLALPLLEETLKLMQARLGPDHPQTFNTMSNLAMAYQAAGKLDLALPLLEQTLKLRQAKLGRDHPDTLISMNNLAMAYQAARKPDLALPLFEETAKLMQAKFGPDHPNTLTSMNNLAAAYHAAGKRDLALPLFEEILKLQRAKLGLDHPDTLKSLNNLAKAYQDSGKLNLALPLFEETVNRMKARLGPDHPDTLTAMNNLAMAYQEAGKLDLAMSLFEQTLRLRRTKLGPDDSNTLVTMSNLAAAYQAAGKLDLALPLFEEVLALTTAKVGPDHPDTLIAMNQLAKTYWISKRFDKSIPLFEEALKRREATLGRQHADTLLCVANLGVNYKDAGRFEEALPLLEESYRAAKKNPGLQWVGHQLLDGYVRAGKTDQTAALVKEMLVEARATLPRDSPQLAGELAFLGRSLLQAKAFDDAEPLLRECLAICEKLKPNGWTTFNTRSMLGGALLGLKKYDEAEPLLLQGYEGMNQREAAIPAPARMFLTEALDRLISLYTSRGGDGDAEHAAKYRKLLEQRQSAGK